MTTGELLIIEPSIIEFQFERMENLSCSLLMSNRTDHFIAFQVQPTAPKNYWVKPNAGFLSPRSKIGVTVTRLAQNMAPLDMQCEDSFLFQSVVTSPGITANDITREMVINQGLKLDEVKLKVVLVAEDTSSKLLSINPLDIEFPFELKKQISSSLQLSNQTHNYVAFKVKTTKPKIYCVRPNKGVLTPLSTRNVTVIMQAQKEAPLDMQCKDKFLIQSMVASPGSTDNDITMEMFDKVGGPKVEAAKLRVMYVASSSVGEVTVKDSFSNNGSLYTPEPRHVSSSHAAKIEPQNNPFTFNKLWDLFFPPSHVHDGFSTGSSLSDFDGSFITPLLPPSKKLKML